MKAFPLISLRCLLFLGVGLLLGGCRKAETTPAATVVGRWELTETSGGLAGRVVPADPNRKQELVLDTQGQIHFLENGTVAQIKTYTTAPGVSTLTQQTETFLLVGPASPPNRLIIQTLTAKELLLQEDGPDGLAYRYQRR